MEVTENGADALWDAGRKMLMLIILMLIMLMLMMLMLMMLMLMMLMLIMLMLWRSLRMMLMLCGMSARAR